MDQGHTISCVVIILSLLVFGSVFEKNLFHPIEAGGPTTTLTISVNTDEDGTFGFSVSGSTSYNIDVNTAGGIGTTGPLSVSPGTYSIQEIVPTGWILNNGVCDVGFTSFSVDTISNIAINFGDNIECDFSNQLDNTTDTDGDGIPDVIDTLPNIISNDFSDIGLGGTTSGTITTRGNQILTLLEEFNPLGVHVTVDVSGGLTPATVSVCGGSATINLNPTNELILTCGTGTSTVDAPSGPVFITFLSSGGISATSLLPNQNSITFAPDTFSFSVPLTNTQAIIINSQEILTLNPGSTGSFGTLKITKITTGGDDTFDFTVNGPISYNPSINTASGLAILLDTLNIGDSSYILASPNIPVIDIGLIKSYNGESISKVTFTVSSDDIVPTSAGTLKAVIYSDIDPNILETGDDSFTLISSRTFQNPWVDDSGNPIHDTSGYHDLVAIFDPPITLAGPAFIGLEAENLVVPIYVLITDGGGLDPQKLCSENASPAHTAFHDCNYEIAMRIESITNGGSGSDGPKIVVSGTYSIQETNPAGWSLIDASCNDAFSSLSAGTMSGIVVNGGDNIECLFQNSFGGSTDIDGDGLSDDVDTLPNVASDDFSDISLGGTSSGTIVTRGDQTLTITEEPNPAGVRITADVSGGLTPATVSVCGGSATIDLDAGDEIIVTCGSVTIDVTSGSVEVTFISIQGTEATTSISQDNSLTFDQDTFSFVAPPTNIDSIIIDIEGTPITVDPGNTNTSPPVVGAITALQDPVQVGALVETSASFTDLGPLETHTAQWDWGDQTTTVGVVTEDGLTGTVTGTHFYSTPGVYTITLTVTDDTGGSGTTAFQYIVIYNPQGGFVTGGGWINSPAGAYVADSSLVGKATFGFVSKYQHGANVPTGNTQFSFKVADLKFKSTEYDWLVVAGSNAKYKGTGTINGQGNYGFQLFGFDADINTNDSNVYDKFRIKIWDKNNGNTVVYDNELGQLENAEPSTIIGGGSIVIHKS